MEKIIIFGTGLIAEVALFYFRRDNIYEIVAFTNPDKFITQEEFNNLPVVSFENIEKYYPPSNFKMFIAIGYTKTNLIREQRYNEAKLKGYKLISYISPKATYYDTPVGDNCFIFENNVIQPYVKIGNNVTLWSGNHIGHHSVIKDHCFISSHVVVSGGCTIEENCFLGVNSTLRDNIIIGKYSIIGAGALVMKDCEERTLVRPSLSSYKMIEHDLI